MPDRSKRQLQLGVLSVSELDRINAWCMHQKGLLVAKQEKGRCRVVDPRVYGDNRVVADGGSWAEVLRELQRGGESL